MRKFEDPDIVTASEIASWTYCPEAWRLGSALGLKPNNEKALARGEHFHEKTASVDVRSEAALRLGFAFVALGLVVLGVLIFLVTR
jgi:hypothetical protein